jgi:restriction endonuclease Mrr
MTEMLEDMNSQPNAAEGFSAAEFYKAGQKYGVTCSEIMVNFLGKARALSRGKYPAVAPDAPLETSRKSKAAAPKPLKAAAKKSPKKAAEKPKKAAEKPKKAVKAPKKTKPSIADEINAELDAEDLDETEETGAVFVYIATPEEIAEEG